MSCVASSLAIDRPIPIAEIPPDLRLRIVGAAGAGFPSPSQDWREDAIDLVELLRLDRAASFVFRVSGSSMLDAGLFDNDVVVVDRDAKPANGRLVIAIVDGGFVIRQLVIRQGVPYLEARNAGMSYPPTVADGDMGVEIWGVVRACVRNLQA
jgi:DNA polymerase V